MIIYFMSSKYRLDRSLGMLTMQASMRGAVPNPDSTLLLIAHVAMNKKHTYL